MVGLFDKAAFKRLPGPTSGPAFWLMMISMGLVVPLVIGLVMTLAVMSMYYLWWLYAGIGIFWRL